MKNLLRQPYFWGLLFVLILLLTQDYLFVKWEAAPAFLGLPNWLLWFVGVHVVFIFIFYFFTKKYWK